MAQMTNRTKRALEMLRVLPRVQLGNLRPNADAKLGRVRGRAQHGGDKHGAGNKGSGQRQNFMRLGYETGNQPFYTRFTYEPYYKGHHLRREYLPLSLLDLQKIIDTNRVNIDLPIDVTALCNTGLFTLRPDIRQFGFHIKDNGADIFKAKINIECQYANELVIATIERNGGVIRTAYYDSQSLWALVNPEKFFMKGVPIPKRILPPQDAIDYYTDAKNRGYLADPEAIRHERYVLSQKYGYQLPKLEDDPKYKMLSEIKDPRQIFYGLHPGWVVNLTDKTIIKEINSATE